jgi:hypothetical protein
MLLAGRAGVSAERLAKILVHNSLKTCLDAREPLKNLLQAVIRERLSVETPGKVGHFSPPPSTPPLLEAMGGWQRPMGVRSPLGWGGHGGEAGPAESLRLSHAFHPDGNSLPFQNETGPPGEQRGISFTEPTGMTNGPPHSKA